jgi:hypothetical protein
MNKSKVAHAKVAAMRFIDAIDLMQADEYKPCNGSSNSSDYFWASPKYRGAVKRASMDLTRALADMRRG